MRSGLTGAAQSIRGSKNYLGAMLGVLLREKERSERKHSRLCHVALTRKEMYLYLDQTILINIDNILLFSML